MSKWFLVFGILVLIGAGYASAHLEQSDDIDQHRQHHIEMHGNDEGFEEMHEHCEENHKEGASMEDHHNSMHGDNHG
jgi:hypothetical protein